MFFKIKRLVHIFRPHCKLPLSSVGSHCLPNKSRNSVMIYDYLDKWLTERRRVMKIPLSYEIHRTRHGGFGDLFNLLAR